MAFGKKSGNMNGVKGGKGSSSGCLKNSPFSGAIMPKKGGK